MSDTTQTPASEPSEPEIPDALVKAQAGEMLTNGEEKTGLDWFLGQTHRLAYWIDLQFETPDGMRPIRFHFHALDPSKFDELDASNRRGDGPFAKLDQYLFAVDVLVEAATHVSDVEDKRLVEIRSQEFMGGIPSPQLAMITRFKGQGGLVESMVEEIRKVSGYNQERIGSAHRSVVEAGKR